MDMRRVLAAIAGASIGLSLAWLAGFDFNERGLGALVVALISLILAATGAAYPFEDRP